MEKLSDDIHLLNEPKIAQVIALKLKNIRLERKYTQKNFAKLIGVSIQQVQKYEKGTNRISPAKLYLIALTFNIHISYFYPKQGEVQIYKFSYQDRVKTSIKSIRLKEAHRILEEFIDIIFKCKEKN